MMPNEQTVTEKKMWVTPQIVEQVSLSRAMATKGRFTAEVTILGVQVGPHS